MVPFGLQPVSVSVDMFQLSDTTSGFSFPSLNFVFLPFVFIDTLLTKLQRDLKKTRQAAYADGTHKNHKTQWRAYLYFCFSFDLEPLPATLDTVCLYCQFLSRSMTPQPFVIISAGSSFFMFSRDSNSPFMRCQS